MIQTPDIPLPVQMLSMITAKWRTMLLSTASELGIIDILQQGPANTSDLAQQTRTKEHMLYRLLRALASIGVLDELDDVALDYLTWVDSWSRGPQVRCGIWP